MIPICIWNCSLNFKCNQGFVDWRGIYTYVHLLLDYNTIVGKGVLWPSIQTWINAVYLISSTPIFRIKLRTRAMPHNKHVRISEGPLCCLQFAWFLSAHSNKFEIIRETHTLYRINLFRSQPVLLSKCRNSGKGETELTSNPTWIRHFV
jgi:hypothetical protein